MPSSARVDLHVVLLQPALKGRQVTVLLLLPRCHLRLCCDKAEHQTQRVKWRECISSIWLLLLCDCHVCV